MTADRPMAEEKQFQSTPKNIQEPSEEKMKAAAELKGKGIMVVTEPEAVNIGNVKLSYIKAMNNVDYVVSVTALMII